MTRMITFMNDNSESNDRDNTDYNTKICQCDNDDDYDDNYQDNGVNIT